jgi:hypothetical protein
MMGRISIEHTFFEWLRSRRIWRFIQRWVKLQKGPKEIKNTTRPLTFTEHTLAEAAFKQSDPCAPPAASGNWAAPPQSQPGTIPLGWTGGLDTALKLRKILAKRKKELCYCVED